MIRVVTEQETNITKVRNRIMDDILGEKIICTNQMLYVLKLCLDWYDGEPCGGDLHVVLDDDNTDDESIDYCYNYTDREDAKKIMVVKTITRISN